MVYVTGLGSLPGVDYAGAVGSTFESVQVPYVPELPGRGPHTSMLARGVASLSGLDAELTTTGWRMSASPGPDLRRARATLRDDLDQVAEAVGDYAGPLRVPICGPWTLIAALEMPRGGAALSDPGARRDIVDSLAEGSAGLVTEVVRRLPQAAVQLQLDEPTLPAVLRGSLPTAGGLFRLAAIDQPEVFAGLAHWGVDRLGVPVDIHCCADGMPWWPLLEGTGLTGAAVDVEMLATADLDGIAAAVDAGHRLALGVIAQPDTTVRVAVERAWSVIRHVDLGPENSARLAVTPACGLATWSVKAAMRVFETLGHVANELEERLAD